MSDQQLCIMMVHAHPDDECLSTGGTLARYSAEGIHTVLITATGGEEGEIVVPEMDTPENHARLSEIRDVELAQAVEALGVNTLERFGYRDSGMDGTEANNHPASFHMADKDDATKRLVTLIRHYKPQVLVSYDERGGYGHPDHIACHQITVAAFDAAGDVERYPDTGEPWTPQKLYYTAFPRTAVYKAWTIMRERGLPTPLDDPEFDATRFTVEDERVTTVIPVHGYLPQKRAAIDAHVTQIRKDSPFLSMPEDIAEDLFGIEHFIRVGSRVDLPSTNGTHEDDLFAGLR
ncbi:MAG: N-acetyl-1-D-myo-inositol-2-amino-2-deoxy-alpha-D-glucopyranoside deacetylase [Chloroflexota bacterium]